MSQSIAFDIVRASAPETELPRVIELRPSPSSTFFLAAMLLPALGAAVVIPYFLSSFLSLGNKNFAGFIWANPLIAAELIMATFLLAALFFYLLTEFLMRVGKRRTIWLTRKNVTIREVSPFNIRAWWVPISEFQGIAHYVRATISDQRHELVLVHPEPGCSVLLHVGRDQPDELMAHYCRQLGLSEIGANSIRRRAIPSLQPA